MIDSNLLKIDKKSLKTIDIYDIGYITIKDSDYVRINSANPLYLIIDKVNGFIEEKNGNKYLTLVSTEKNKEVLKKHVKPWDGIKNLIENNSIKAGEYENVFMKIKFNPDDKLPINTILRLHGLTMNVRSIFEEDGKYYPQAFLDECLYEL